MDHLDNLGEPHEIDGVSFRIAKLGYRNGRQLFVRLMKMVGPALADMAERAPSLAALGQQLEGFDPASLGVLMDKVSDAELEYFADLLGGVSRYSKDGTKFLLLDAGQREILFQGRLLFSLKWMRRALEVQYGDFLSEFARQSASGTTEGQAASESPSQS